MAGPDRDFSDLFTRRHPVILVHNIAVKLIHLIMEQLSHPLATHTPIDPMVATVTFVTACQMRLKRNQAALASDYYGL